MRRFWNHIGGFLRVALEEERNARQATIDWQFTTRQARVTLKRLYPVVKGRID